MADTTLPGLLDVGTHAGRPAASAVGSGGLYSCTDHSLVYQTDGSSWSTWASLTGTGIATTLADNAGDMLVASANDTWAKLATPTVDGQAVRRVSGSVAWDLPPGHEYDYTAKTSDVTVNGTTEGGANTIVTSGSVTLDGSTVVIVEWFSPRVQTGASSGSLIVLDLYVDSTIQGRIGVVLTPAAGALSVPVLTRTRLTPSNAAHTFTVKAWRGTSDGTVYGGSGGTGANVAGYIRVTKA